MQKGCSNVSKKHSLGVILLMYLSSFVLSYRYNHAYFTITLGLSSTVFSFLQVWDETLEAISNKWLNKYHLYLFIYPASKVRGANMGPTWILSAPGRPHVGPVDLVIRVSIRFCLTSPIAKRCCLPCLSTVHRWNEICVIQRRINKHRSVGLGRYYKFPLVNLSIMDFYLFKNNRNSNELCRSLCTGSN